MLGRACLCIGTVRQMCGMLMCMKSESGHVAFILGVNKKGRPLAMPKLVPVVFPLTVNRFGFI